MADTVVTSPNVVTALALSVVNAPVDGILLPIGVPLIEPAVTLPVTFKLLPMDKLPPMTLLVAVTYKLPVTNRLIADKLPPVTLLPIK